MRIHGTVLMPANNAAMRPADGRFDSSTVYQKMIFDTLELPKNCANFIIYLHNSEKYCNFAAKLV